MYDPLDKYLTEFFGTLFLAFIIFKSGNYFLIGATLTLAAILGGHISGAAFNPAVTVGMYIKGDLQMTDLIMYTISQILGVVVAVYFSQIKM